RVIGHTKKAPSGTRRKRHPAHEESAIRHGKKVASQPVITWSVWILLALRFCWQLKERAAFDFIMRVGNLFRFCLRQLNLSRPWLGGVKGFALFTFVIYDFCFICTCDRGRS